MNANPRRIRVQVFLNMAAISKDQPRTLHLYTFSQVDDTIDGIDTVFFYWGSYGIQTPDLSYQRLLTNIG
jgi:hypothetical protein